MQEREAINEILVNINELPLDDTDVIEDINIAVIANKFLDVARKQVLSYGWNFNTLTISYFPNTSGYIIIPETHLSVDGDDVVVRDYKLYSNANSSFLFEEAVVCEVIDDVVFNDIPYHCANYIVKIASLTTYSNLIGDVSGMQIRTEAMKEAKIEAMRDEANKIDGNILESTYATTLLDKTSL